MPILDEPKAWDETFESDGELTALCGRTARTSSPLRTWTDITTDSDGTCWMTLDGKSSKNAEPYRFPPVGDVGRSPLGKVVRLQQSNGKDSGGSVWESNPPSSF